MSDAKTLPELERLVDPVNFSPPSYVPLREYIEARIRGLEKASDLAWQNLQIRLEGMNEWRQQSKDQSQTYTTKFEYDSHTKTVLTELSDLRERKLNKAEYESAISRLSEDVRILRESKALLEGKASQQSVTTVFILSSIGTAVGVLSLILGIVGLLRNLP